MGTPWEQAWVGVAVVSPGYRHRGLKGRQSGVSDEGGGCQAAWSIEAGQREVILEGLGHDVSVALGSCAEDADGFALTGGSVAVSSPVQSCAISPPSLLDANGSS